MFETLMRTYGIAHKLATPYDPQTSGHVEISISKNQMYSEKDSKSKS